VLIIFLLGMLLKIRGIQTEKTDIFEILGRV